MIDAVIRPTMTRAAQAAVPVDAGRFPRPGGVCARAGDGAASGTVMTKPKAEEHLHPLPLRLPMPGFHRKPVGR